MGFRQAKSRLLTALGSGELTHESRSVQQLKNLLSTDELSLTEAIRIVSATRGGQADCNPHHFAPEIEVWIFKPVFEGQGWYVKFYDYDDQVVIISIHLQEDQ